MDKLINVDKLIKKAAQQKINFGKGDPYNRLRYYTKIGWLPHMIRKKSTSGEVRGHYPESAFETLLYIERLKAKGLSNEQIERKVKARAAVTNIFTTLKSKEFKTRAAFAVMVILLVLVLSSELGIIKLGADKDSVYKIGRQPRINKVLASGDAFVSRDQKKVFLSVKEVQVSSRIMVTFTQDYFPATRYWISEIKPGDGFTLELDTNPQNNTGFSWWIAE